MCGRFSLTTQAPLAEWFMLPEAPELPARYNIAPTQQVPAIRILDAGGGRKLDFLKWGLIPAWAKDGKAGPINARSDTVMEKPMFRNAFKARRCLVPADGFFEWETRDKKKYPVYFQMKDAGLFALAGLWERWKDPDGVIVESFALLTTDANEVVGRIHDRMPVIVRPEQYARWLDPAITDPAALLPLLAPYDAEAMVARYVSTRVNSARFDGPECLEAFAEQGTLL